MKPEELHVHKFLESLGYDKILFEPDGKNTCPDFSILETIGIEVRRLNENWNAGEKWEGLENGEISLGRKIQDLLNSFETTDEGHTWFVSFKFERPLEKWTTLKKTISRALTEFAQSPHEQGGIIVNESRFQMRIIHKSSVKHKKQFLIGSSIDENSGGQLLPLIKDNINICISEKTLKREDAIKRKIGRGEPPYQSWWLILVDHFCFGPHKIEKELRREKFQFNHDWAKVVVLDPNDITKWIEI